MNMPHTDLRNVRRPIDQANGLGNAHYIDPAIFAEERQAVLFNNWPGLATASDVPEIGDAVPLTFLGMPLLVLRDKSGQVRVFQNTCRHRGMILVDAPRKIEG
ncbi:MAG: choline monooxygenase, partial [Sulfitobacter sp.]